MHTDNSTLQAARSLWLAAARFRSRRERNMRYTFGDQWSDLIPDATGHPVREGDYAAHSGAHPITNNLIRPLVKTIVGRYRASRAESYDHVPFAQANALPELDARMLEEYLISGAAVQRIAPTPQGEAVVDNVSPNHFFVNRLRDPRGRDATILGMLHDMTLPELLNRFAGDSAARAREIARCYQRADDACCFSQFGAASEAQAAQFDAAPDGFCRVIEVWTLDAAPVLACADPKHHAVYDLPVSAASQVNAANRRRTSKAQPPISAAFAMPTHWHCRWLTPDGHVLDDYASPLPFGQHPFAFKFYPLTDGAVHPFVDDLIEQQRAVNRLVTLTDHMMSTSAKGVLLFPEECLSDDMPWSEVSERWSRCDGVIPIRAYAGALPQQVNAGCFQSGVAEVLATQLQLFRLTSGVPPVLMGQEQTSSRGAGMYEQQIDAADTSLRDLMDSFASLIARRDAALRAIADSKI